MSQSTSPPVAQSSIDPLLSDKWYTIFKHGAALVLPAVTTLYIVCASLWHWSDTDAVVGTLTALTALVGGTMTVSTLAYNSSGQAAAVGTAGELLIATDEDGHHPALNLNAGVLLEDILKLKQVVFNVKPVSPVSSPAVTPPTK